MKQYQVSIVIITEKSTLSQEEQFSLDCALEVFATFNKYLVIPESTVEYPYLKESQTNVLKLPSRHFANVNAYSALLLSADFYENFIDSEYILIYQLDCLVFKNDFSEFLAFDYVGAPWYQTQNHAANAIIRTLLFRKPLKAIQLIGLWYLRRKTDAVGNGGLSLRKVDKFIEITSNPRIKKILSSWLKCPRPHEDIFFSLMVPMFYKDFKIADLLTATKFSFETHPRECYKLNNNTLPLGCHAWEKHDPEFWRKIIRNYE
jgi:hypothetical protein